MTDIRIPQARALDWTSQMFERVGMGPKDAWSVAEQLVAADLRGVYSHGIMRVPIYLQRLEGGAVDPLGQPSVLNVEQAVGLVDGGNAMGQIAGAAAMSLAIDLARDFGVSFVGVRNSNHYGACAHFGLMAVEAGMVGITATVGGKNIMAPWGGTQRLLGNNPFAVAIPSDVEAPVVLDMAMSVAANGKIMLAAKQAASIPEGWALDSDGNPTTDAAAALAGMVRPLADHKGYGMSFVTGLLAGILPGAAFGDDVTDWFADFEHPQNVGHYMIALDISRFMDPGEFRRSVDGAIRLMRAAPLAAWAQEVLVPGEREGRLAAEQSRLGILYDPSILAELAAESSRLQLEPLETAQA